MATRTMADVELAPTMREAGAADVLCTGETAECECPDFCERDHANE